MSRPKVLTVVDSAHAVLHRIDQGHGNALTLAQAIEVTEHPVKDHTRQELVELIAYLGCQVVGYRQSVDQDAALAMHHIGRIVDEHRAQGARVAAGRTAQAVTSDAE